MATNSDLVLATVASNTTKVGAVATVAGATANYTGWAAVLVKHGELISVLGVCFGIFCTGLGTLVTLYFKWRAHKRAQDRAK